MTNESLQSRLARIDARMLDAVETRLGCDVTLSKRITLPTGATVPVWRVPVDFIAPARALGLTVEDAEICERCGKPHDDMDFVQTARATFDSPAEYEQWCAPCREPGAGPDPDREYDDPDSDYWARRRARGKR